MQYPELKIPSNSDGEKMFTKDQLHAIVDSMVDQQMDVLWQIQYNELVEFVFARCKTWDEKKMADAIKEYAETLEAREAAIDDAFYSEGPSRVGASSGSVRGAFWKNNENILQGLGLQDMMWIHKQVKKRTRNRSAGYARMRGALQSNLSAALAEEAAEKERRLEKEAA